MELDYEITQQQEVLIEVAADIHADYCRYIDAVGIEFESETNPVAMLAHDTFQLKEDILLANTNDELNVLRGKIRMSKAVIERLMNNDRVLKVG
jgi:hypothetical protein